MYIIDVKILPKYIDSIVFLNVLEQYLFFIHKPTINIYIVASNRFIKDNKSPFLDYRF